MRPLVRGLHLNCNTKTTLLHIHAQIDSQQRVKFCVNLHIQKTLTYESSVNR